MAMENDGPAHRGDGGGALEVDRLDGTIGYLHSTPRAASKHPITTGLIRGLAGHEVYGNARSTAFIRERIRKLARGAFAVQGRGAFESNPTFSTRAVERRFLGGAGAEL